MSLATVGEVVALLDELEIPNTQLMWADQKPPLPPYVVLVPHETKSLYADCGVWFEIRRYDLELYSKERDIPLEKQISSALRKAEIAYSSDVVVDEKGQVAITYFSTTLIEQEAENA